MHDTTGLLELAHKELLKRWYYSWPYSRGLVMMVAEKCKQEDGCMCDTHYSLLLYCFMHGELDTGTSTSLEN